MINIHTQKMDFIRTMASILTALVVAVFVHLYGLLQANFLQYGHKIQMNILPLPTMLYFRFSVLGYLLPPAGRETLSIPMPLRHSKSSN